VATSTAEFVPGAVSSVAAAAETAAARTRFLVFPREHGAWGMLLVPLLTGGLIALRSGGDAIALVLLVVCCLSLFCLRTPLEAVIGASPFRVRSSHEINVVVRAVVGYGAIGASALAFLLDRVAGRPLWLLGLAAALAFVVQIVGKKLWPGRRALGQVAGAAGLTATAAAAWYVTSGRWSWAALLVWALNWMFALNQIEYVQTRIHAARAATLRLKLAAGSRFLAGEIACGVALVAAAAAGWMSWWALLAFVPVLARGAAWFLQSPAPLKIHRLGLTELAHAIAFGMLLVLAF
jgi:YwiC-like protein